MIVLGTNSFFFFFFFFVIRKVGIDEAYRVSGFTDDLPPPLMIRNASSSARERREAARG